MSYTDTTNSLTLTDFVIDVISKEIMLQAQPVLKFYQFAQKVTDLSVAPGNVIKMPRLGNLPRGIRLGEPGVSSSDATSYNTARGYDGTPNEILSESSIPMHKMSGSSIEIRVQEYGNGVSISEFQLKSSFEDTMMHAGVLLGRDYAQVVDDCIRDAILGSATNKLFGGMSANRSSLTTLKTHGLTMEDVRYIHERLATAKAVTFADAGGEAYFQMVTPHQASQLRSESGFLDVTKYAIPGIAMSGEIGKIEKVRFVETTALPVIKGAGVGNDMSTNLKCGTNLFVKKKSDGTYTPLVGSTHFTLNTDTYYPNAYAPMYVDGELYSYVIHATYELVAGTPAVPTWTVVGSVHDVHVSVVFGDYSFGFAEALPVELRDGGVKEHGRVHELVWYSVFGAGVLNTDSILVVETL